MSAVNALGSVDTALGGLAGLAELCYVLGAAAFTLLERWLHGVAAVFPLSR